MRGVTKGGHWEVGRREWQDVTCLAQCRLRGRKGERKGGREKGRGKKRLKNQDETGYERLSVF